MDEWFLSLSPVFKTFIATCFTWFATALGASVVFLFKKINRKTLDSMLGFAAGVMIAACFWSLLAPAIEMSEQMGLIKWLPPLLGFAAGGLFMRIIDRVLPHLHLGMPSNQAEGIKTNWQRSILLVLAITLHNIPEGLAVGVAFGALGAGTTTATLAGAIALTIGISIQDFPEGIAVSVPLRREGLSRFKSFWYGQLSGFVEVIAGIVGALAVTSMTSILPYALSFSAGAMMYVVIEELIPESQMGNNTDIATIGTLIGFAIMMTLDVAFS